MRRILFPAAFALLPVLLATPLVDAQWRLEDSGSGADLRGIDNIGEGVAWASGSNGTVLRTLDMGKTWGHCTTPPNAEKLDFRGIQAFDKDTALVMSSGKGDLSRLYKTTDGCKTWKLVFSDPDETGFFDAIRRVTEKQLFVLGDPVSGKFSMFTSRDAGSTWFIADDPGLEAPAGAGAFAASNSSFTSFGTHLAFGSGGPQAAVYRMLPHCDAKTGVCNLSWQAFPTPLAHGEAAAGVFSLAGHLAAGASGKTSVVIVAVGGNYEKPADPTGTAAFSTNDGATWTVAPTLPHGYRSAVAYDPKTNTWITVGPNGTDLSADDGRNWRPLKPDPAANDSPDADQHWNALSLPFVVGPHGRIGLLRPDALTPANVAASR